MIWLTFGNLAIFTNRDYPNLATYGTHIKQTTTGSLDVTYIDNFVKQVLVRMFNIVWALICCELLYVPKLTKSMRSEDVWQNVPLLFRWCRRFDLVHITYRNYFFFYKNAPKWLRCLSAFFLLYQVVLETKYQLSLWSFLHFLFKRNTDKPIPYLSQLVRGMCC